jgi:hypothetical protein
MADGEPKALDGPGPTLEALAETDVKFVSGFCGFFVRLQCR